MRNITVATEGRFEAARAFETAADTIMYRWSVERDPWVSSIELDQARAYLERAGVDTSTFAARPSSDTADTLEAARVVLLGLRHLQAHRRRFRI